MKFTQTNLSTGLNTVLLGVVKVCASLGLFPVHKSVLLESFSYAIFFIIYLLLIVDNKFLKNILHD